MRCLASLSTAIAFSCTSQAPADVAPVSELDAVVLESMPPQIEITASGPLPRCRVPGEPRTRRSGRVLEVRIPLLAADCAAGEPTWEKTVTWDAASLAAGLYEVEVNGSRVTLPIDLEAAAPHGD